MASGWDIATAIAKTVPAQNLDWERRASERQLYVQNSKPDHFQFDERRLSYEKNLQLRRDRANGDHADARAKTHAEFRKIMASGKLVARGFLNGATGERCPIEPSRWHGLTKIGEGNSAAVDHSGKVGFVGVTVFPALEALDAPEIIAGRSVGDVLHDFVLRDPEIEALHDAASDVRATELCAIIGTDADGGCLVPMSDSRTDIRKALSTFKALRDEASKLTAIGEAIASRLAALGKIMISGNLVAHGIRHGDKQEIARPVPRGVLEKPSTRLCLATGGIWLEQGGEKQPLFHDVRLALPQANAAAAGKTADGGQSSKRTGGGSTIDNWQEAIPITIGKALSEGKKIVTHGQLRKAIAIECKAMGKTVPEDAAIKKHLERRYRGFLDAITAVNKRSTDLKTK